jgi:hypothetical protein
LPLSLLLYLFLDLGFGGLFLTKGKEVMENNIDGLQQIKQKIINFDNVGKGYPINTTSEDFTQDEIEDIQRFAAFDLFTNSELRALVMILGGKLNERQ